MADQLPDPPVPASVDLRHYDDMPLEVRRLRDSGIAGVPNAEVFRCAVLLWCVSWHQVPAGSLANDEAELCRLVGLGRDLKTWRKIRAGVLRGWHEFADGRLYHKVVAEKVIEGWNRTLLKGWTTACDRQRKENKARAERREAALPMPGKPAVVPLEWPKEYEPNSDGNSAGVPAEKRLKRIEGNGIEGKDTAAAASGTDTPRAGAGAVPAEPPPTEPTRSADPHGGVEIGQKASNDGPSSDDPAVEEITPAADGTDDLRPPPHLDRSVDRAFTLWQQTAAKEGWPEAMFLNGERRVRLQAILAICGGVDGFAAALETAKDAKFLHGSDGRMHRWFHLDWILDQSKFTRLMEGRYAERHDSSNEQRSSVAALADWGREGDS